LNDLRATHHPFGRLAVLSRRTDVRLAIAGIVAVLAVYLGFLGVPVHGAEEFVKRGGYYVMLATFALFLHALWRLWRLRTPAAEPLTRSQRALTAIVVIALSMLAINAEPYEGKVLNDEFVLQSTAFNLHYFRDVATMVRGYDVQGVFLSTDNYLDKRPYFYPFLVSVAHDLTGYRVANAFLVNSLLMPVALLLIFAFGRALAGWRGGLLATLLLGTLPLLGQNATGSGMELLNVVMILAALLLGYAYLRQPDESRIAAFALATVLLAQSRYESALYVAPAAVLIVLGWKRAGRVCLPWVVILVPLLLVPCALQNKVLSNSPLLWELTDKSASRFSLDYLHGNLLGVFQFLFNPDAERANSLLLSATGLLALLGALWFVVRPGRAHATNPAARQALGIFSLAILANTILVFFYYWANFNDPMASRFSLPLHLLLAFAVVLVAAECDVRLPATRTLLLAASLFGLATATGKFGHHYYSHLGIDELEWERRYVNALPPARRLILSHRTSLPWLLQKTPAILLDRAKLVADRLEYQLHEPTFQEILVTQSLRPTTPDGDHQIAADERLPSYFKLETLAEKRFGTRLSRISRLVAVDLPPDWRGPVSPPPARAEPAAPRPGE
jgi:hypothetical protein